VQNVKKPDTGMISACACVGWAIDAHRARELPAVYSSSSK
jgi:hypothetical protein